MEDQRLGFPLLSLWQPRGREGKQQRGVLGRLRRPGRADITPGGGAGGRRVGKGERGRLRREELQREWAPGRGKGCSGGTRVGSAGIKSCPGFFLMALGQQQRYTMPWQPGRRMQCVAVMLCAESQGGLKGVGSSPGPSLEKEAGALAWD